VPGTTLKSRTGAKRDQGGGSLLPPTSAPALPAAYKRAQLVNSRKHVHARCESRNGPTSGRERLVVGSSVVGRVVRTFRVGYGKRYSRQRRRSTTTLGSRTTNCITTSVTASALYPPLQWSPSRPFTIHGSIFYRIILGSAVSVIKSLPAACPSSSSGLISMIGATPCAGLSSPFYPK